MLTYLKIFGAFGLLANAVSNNTISQAHPKKLRHQHQMLSRENAEIGAAIVGAGAAGAVAGLGTLGTSLSGGKDGGVDGADGVCLEAASLKSMLQDWSAGNCLTTVGAKKGESVPIDCPVDPRQFENGDALDGVRASLAMVQSNEDGFSNFTIVWKYKSNDCAQSLPFQTLPLFFLASDAARADSPCTLLDLSVGDVIDKSSAPDYVADCADVFQPNVGFCGRSEGGQVVYSGKGRCS